MGVDYHGVLLVDKPTGISSAGVVRTLKFRLKANKVGHGGTLDPFATGVLVVLFGKATKLSSRFLDGDKSYSGCIRLGIGTDTEDITGQVIERDETLAEKFPIAAWTGLEERIRESFTGTIEQIPPKYSALRVNGKRSYELARRGLDVEHEPRQVEIRKLEVHFQSSTSINFSLRCSKGTYVRSLARDIGKRLGSCACLETLRRESSSHFTVDEAFPMDSITVESISEGLLSPEQILERLSAKHKGEEDTPLVLRP